MKPKITFVNSNREKEANYICFLAKNITRNLYQDGGFIVLPSPIKHEKSVYFPDLRHSPRFWNSIKNTKSIDYNDRFPEVAVVEIIDKLKSKTQNKRQLDLTEFWTLCERYYGNSPKFNKIRSIDIFETEYGTSGSWDIVYEKDYIDITITWRTDFPPSNLIRTLLLALYTIVTGRKAEIGEDYWFERRAVVEFLLKYSEFSNGYKALKQALDSSLLTESELYLEKLGFPSKPCISSKRGSLFVSDYNLESILSKQEYTILQYLYSENGSLVTFDALAEVLWKDNSDEKFSLYAIAKVIENIRKKIRLLGVNKEVIVTVRGKGYVLR